jgi:hypothetical protein
MVGTRSCRCSVRRTEEGADKGIDGRTYFHEGPGQTKQIILSVKDGKLHAPNVRDLRGMVEREKAVIGVAVNPGRAHEGHADGGRVGRFYTSP